MQSNKQKRTEQEDGRMRHEFSTGARNQKLTINVFLIEKTRQRPLPGPKSMANNVSSRGLDTLRRYIHLDVLPINLLCRGRMGNIYENEN